MLVIGWKGSIRALGQAAYVHLSARHQVPVLQVQHCGSAAARVQPVPPASRSYRPYCGTDSPPVANRARTSPLPPFDRGRPSAPDMPRVATLCVAAAIGSCAAKTVASPDERGAPEPALVSSSGVPESGSSESEQSA